MASNPDVTGYSKPIESDRGQDPSPLKATKPPGPAKYATPARHPNPVDAGADNTGKFGGDKARSQRTIKVQP
jgi:hypothetical protein